MEVIVHRGTHQIGGCVTEIKSKKGTRIVIDIGSNLPSMRDDEEYEKTEIDLAGLTNYEKPLFDAVLVTHYHGDHIGLFNKILPEIPIYIGEISKEIFKRVQTRLVEIKKAPKEDLEIIKRFITFRIPNEFYIKDIKIKPIEVDHSAFNAHMFLIECDGKRLLHTGDFRLHGQRGKAVIPALERYIGKVDCLICEGTTLSREKESTNTEWDLQEQAKQIFKDNKSTFVLCSSTNIDRIAAIHKAAIECNRLFVVCDRYQLDLLMYIDKVARSDYYKFNGKMRVYGKDDVLELMKKMGFVMLVRANYISKHALKEFPENKFIYSQWLNYLNKENTRYKYLQDFVPKDYVFLHTSGHADRESIIKVCETVRPKKIIPIHSEKPEEFMNLRIRQL